MSATMAIDRDSLTSQGRLVHLVHTRQLSRTLLEQMFEVADEARRLNTSRPGAMYLRECLVGRLALLYFVQPSTRTFLSFQAAASVLGMSTAEVRSREISSEMKGESALDSVRTFAMYHDLIVIRYPEPGFSEACARMFVEFDLRRHVINGGSGPDDHPTQALLDLYTLHREFYNRGGVDGKRVLVVGDLARGRAVRSFLHLLARFDDVKVDLVAPDQLRLGPDVRALVDEGFVEVREDNEIEKFLPDADAVYMTRVQSEYDAEDADVPADVRAYALSEERVAMMRPNAVIMHPLPRQAEIPVSLDRDPRSRYWDQVENGMWARVGLIAHMLGCDARIKAA
jgi:aspartate carbamoyltransferase catalytic subunit